MTPDWGATAKDHVDSRRPRRHLPLALGRPRQQSRRPMSKTGGFASLHHYSMPQNVMHSTKMLGSSARQSNGQVASLKFTIGK